MSDLQTYAEAVRVIKEAILRSQFRAASSANKEQLSLYYGIGCYVSKNSRKGFWGKGAIDTISQQLQKELPGLRGFSATNIKNMRSFYEEWSPIINRQPMADENKTCNYFHLYFMDLYVIQTPYFFCCLNDFIAPPFYAILIPYGIILVFNEFNNLFLLVQ